MAQVGWGRVEPPPQSASAHPAPIQVLELLELCRARVAALVHGGALAASASLGQLQAGSDHHLCGSLWLPRLLRADG